MTLRKFIEKLETKGKLIRIKKEVSTEFEIANLLAALDGEVVFFENVKDSKFPVVGNLVSSRDLVASALGIQKEQLLEKLAYAINNKKEPEIIDNGPCQEVEEELDLNKLPILRYMPKDGGKYIASGVCIIKDPETGIRNSCFHRLMLLDRNHLVPRIVEHRGTDTALKKTGELDIAICIGSSVPVLLAGATTLPIGVDELGMANSMEETKLVKCKTIDVEVPADTEFVIEGRITKQMTKEGPFLDLTETYDKIREQPVIEVKKITHRKDALFHALLPGKGEHKVLMGMPREPTIFNEVNKVCRCKNVLVTPGGTSWLHAVVQIIKQNDDDGRKALEAAFKGHTSLKHCVIVDDDINIYDPSEVEWAIATRFQADRNLVVMPNQSGSSLDPSGDLTEGKKAMTCKAGFDATIPWGKKDKSFKKEKYGITDPKSYL
ncbi:MAG: UbiD family decarboxylase [Candidatus Micrarchaeales archaeon]|jgi:UbiD family decarboxylase